jgi:hypothetical protein
MHNGRGNATNYSKGVNGDHFLAFCGGKIINLRR